MQNPNAKVQRFIAADMSSALKMLTERFGADAILLASRRVNQGVEVAGLPAGSDPARIDSAQIYGERRHSERRAQERRNDAHAGAGNAASMAANSALAESNPLASGDSAGASPALAAGDRQRRTLGESLSRLRSDYASLLGDLHGADLAAPGTHEPLAEFDQPAAEPAIGIRRAASKLARQIDVLGAAPAEAVEDETHSSELELPVEEIQQELKALKALLADSLANHSQQAILPQPAQYIVLQRLRQMGFSAEVGTALLRSTGSIEQQASGFDGVEALWSAAREQLKSVLPLCSGELVAAGGVFALLGPAGAGKSSVLSMLLARLVEQQKSAEVAVISMDGARCDTLAELTTLAGITYLPVDSDFSLATRIAQCARFRTVLIDTGSGRDDADAVQAMLDELRAGEVKIKELLLLPATGEQRYLQRVVQHYRSSHTVACILTFYDQVAALGEIFSLLLRERLDVAYLASGALLPEHLVLPDKQVLLEQLVFADDEHSMQQLVHEVMVPTVHRKVDSPAYSLTI